MTDIISLEVAIDTFEMDAGRPPTSMEGLRALANRPAGVINWNGPYVKRHPVDPWGNPYLYRTRASAGVPDFRVDCLGPDGKPGTADDINGAWRSGLP